MYIEPRDTLTMVLNDIVSKKPLTISPNVSESTLVLWKPISYLHMYPSLIILTFLPTLDDKDIVAIADIVHP